MKILVIQLFILITLCMNANAFDGNRKGFVLGAGAVFSPYLSDHDKTTGTTNTDIEYGISIIGGYGLSQTNIITWEIMFIMTHETYSKKRIGKHVQHTRYSYLKWFHYFRTRKQRLFGSLGIGQLNIYDDDVHTNAKGLGYSAGLGYQVSSHSQIELTYVIGNSLGKKDNIRYQTLFFTARFLAF